MFSPMLAGNVEDISQIVLPCFVSVKLDGIRAIKYHGSVLSRTMKLIPNIDIRRALDELPDGLDGELITYDETGKPDDFNTIQSKVMSRNITTHFLYFVFDYFETPNQSFVSRFSYLMSLPIKNPFVTLLQQITVNSPQELESFRQNVGGEGIIVRSPSGIYKYGRSTVDEGYLLKIKNYEDAEATIVGFQELVRQDHDRSTGLLGALICKDEHGNEFNIGSGFTQSQRRNLWLTRNALNGKLVTYKRQKFGAKDKPRIPVFKGIRLELCK